MDNPMDTARDEEPKKYTMDFDELLIKRVGEFGKKQIFLSMLLAYSGLCSCVHSLGTVFLAGVPNHWCQTTDEIFSNCTESQIKTLTVPKEYKDVGSVYSQCSVYAQNYTVEDIAQLCTNNGTLGVDLSSAKTVQCEKWQYDTTVYPENIVSEWGLVCANAGYASTVAAVYMAGRIIGSLVSGQIADRFGRRITLVASGLLFLIASFSCSAMPEYISFVGSRLLMSIFMTVRDNIGIVLAVELVGPSWRVFVTVVWLTFWSVGYFVLAGLAYIISGWRLLQALLTIPDVLLFIAYFFFVPESPRWLLVKNKQDKAMKIIRDIAKGNGRNLPENITASTQEEKTAGTNLDLVKTTSIRLISFILAYLWFSNSFVYYGLSLNASNLGGSPYTNFMLSGAVEVISYAYMWWSFSKFGRIRPFGYIFVVAGLSLLAIMVVPSDVNWLVITFAMAGKCAISASFGMVWMYTMEIYPTSIRTLGISMCCTFGRVASVLASYVGMLSNVSRELPLLIFGAMALLGGVLVFILPETRGQPMTQTVEEGEEFIRQNMCQFGPCKRCRKQTTKEKGDNKMNSVLA